MSQVSSLNLYNNAVSVALESIPQIPFSQAQCCQLLALIQLFAPNSSNLPIVMTVTSSNEQHFFNLSGIYL